MAVAAITNKQIVDALKLLGVLPPDANPPTTGAQSSKFVMTLVGTTGISYQDFARAKEFVRIFQDAGAWDQNVVNEVLATTEPGGKRPARSMYDRFLETAETRLRQGITSLRGRAGPQDASVKRASEALSGFQGAVKSFIAADERGVPSFVPKGLDVGPRDIQSPQTRPRTTPLTTKTPPTPPGGAPPGGGPGGGPIRPQGPAAPPPTDLPPPPRPQTPEEIRAEIEATYGWAAGLADIPEIAKILNDAYAGRISPSEANNKFLGSTYYKTTTQAERTWKSFEKTDPAEAKTTWQTQYHNLGAKLKAMGVEPGTVRLDTLTDLSLRFGWSEQQVNSFIASEIKYDPTKQKAGIFKQLGDLQREYLVPLSDQAKTAWAQSIVAGTKTAADYEAYLRESAVSLFPALANALEDPEMTVRKYLDPYEQVIAKQLGMTPADIDWEAPKFQRFITQVDPKTNGRTVMSLADVTRTIRTDKQYGWADTANGKEEQAALARTILQDFGLAPATGATFRGA